jgi:hypothetical protein
MPLEESFDYPTHVLETDEAIIFCLDSELRLTYCNLAWDRFALLNGGNHLARPALVGKCVLDSIVGPDRDYYATAYKHVLAANEPWEHDYECSSKHMYRKFRLRVVPMQKGPGLLVISSLQLERSHTSPSQPPLEDLYRTREGLLIMCSSCRRTRRNTPGQSIWDWVPKLCRTYGVKS